MPDNYPRFNKPTSMVDVCAELLRSTAKMSGDPKRMASAEVAIDNMRERAKRTELLMATHRLTPQ